MNGAVGQMSLARWLDNPGALVKYIHVSVNRGTGSMTGLLPRANVGACL